MSSDTDAEKHTRSTKTDVSCPKYNCRDLEKCIARETYTITITFNIDFYFFVDRHHFDNPVYSTNFTTGPGGSGGGAINGAVLGQVVFPLNNVACVNRVVNRFATNSMSSNGASTCKNTLNSDRERLRGFGGVEVRIPTAPTLENDGLTNSITYHDSVGHSSSIRRGNVNII